MNLRVGPATIQGMTKKRDTVRPDSADADRILKRLDQAVHTGNLVRIHRSIRGAEKIEGFAVATTPSWTLMAPCSDIQLDGWAAVRTADIVKVRRKGDKTCLTIRALHRRGQWPVIMPGHTLPLDTLPALVEAAHRAFGLVALHAERHVADACWIGAVTEVRTKSVRLREIDPSACWHDDVTKFPGKDITRIDFGGRYVRTLDEFAGPRTDA